MNAFCLFCETQRCETIAALIRKTYGIRCLYPHILQRKWVKGKEQEVPHPWLPGYLFLYSENPSLPRLEISGILRVLGGGALTGTDLDFARMLLEREGVLGTVRLIQEGDRCTVADPLWRNLQGTVVKMDRGRKRCCVEFEFDHLSRTVWVGYELLCPQTV